MNEQDVHSTTTPGYRQYAINLNFVEHFHESDAAGKWTKKLFRTLPGVRNDLYDYNKLPNKVLPYYRFLSF